MVDVVRDQVTTLDGRIGGTLCRSALIDVDAPLLVCVHGGGCNSRYFDIKGASLAQAAMQRGIPVLLVDRPGYGTSAPSTAKTPIACGAAAVHALIDSVRATRRDLANRAIAMIGHSIGGAVALHFAADPSAPPLAALCVSGIGDIPMPEVVAFARARRRGPTVEPPAEWFFGPEGSYGWQGPAALRAAAEPWRSDEVDDVIDTWPARWPTVAAAIRCSVQLRLAEFERIWDATPAGLNRMAAALSSALAVDAAIAPDGGHLYEIHHRGSELIAAQLDFLLTRSLAWMRAR